MFEHKAHMSLRPPTIYYRGEASRWIAPLSGSFFCWRAISSVGRRYFKILRNSARELQKAPFSHTLAPARPQLGGQEAGLSASRGPLCLLCLVSVATESEGMQHPDARSGGIPPLTQGRGKRRIADGAKARCRICRESKGGPRIGRPQSESLFGQLFGSLCQKCAKCCLCLKRLRFLWL